MLYVCVCVCALIVIFQHHNYLSQGDNVFTSVCLSVCLQDYMKCYLTISTKFCIIKDYCYRRNSVSFVANPPQKGRMAADLHFSYNIFTWQL